MIGFGWCGGGVRRARTGWAWPEAAAGHDGLLPGAAGCVRARRAAYQSKRDAGVSSFGTPGSRAPRRRPPVGGLAFAYPSRVARDQRATQGLDLREAPAARRGRALH